MYAQNVLGNRFYKSYVQFGIYSVDRTLGWYFEQVPATKADMAV